jgi:hypothetical protein
VNLLIHMSAPEDQRTYNKRLGVCDVLLGRHVVVTEVVVQNTNW